MRLKRSPKSVSEHATEIVDTITPQVEAAKDKVLEDYLPQAQQAVAGAVSTARDVVADAVTHAKDAIPSPQTPSRRSHRGRNLLAVLGLAGIGALIFKWLRGERAQQPTYSPPKPGPSPMAESAAQPVAEAADRGAASPDELLADADAGPRPATTPDQPVEKVDVSSEPDPDAETQD